MSDDSPAVNPSPADVPASTPTPSESPETSAAHPPVRRSIGSQRPHSPQVRAKPQRGAQPEPRAEKKTPVPHARQQLAPEDELELVAAMGEASLEEMLDPAGAEATRELEAESSHTATVLAIHQDDVFVDLGGRNQGVMSLRQLPEPPTIGARIPVVIQRYSPEDGLYYVGLVGTAVAIEDWSQVAEGMLVEAHITGHNKGGLECQVSQLHGFIPASQIAPFRVEDFAPFVGERWTCLVSEVNAERRKLVLSRRAVLEREKEAAREQVMTQLAEGQIREGIVRSLQDFGAFVDIGGVDGLVHISQLSWQRVKHPSEVLSVGQKVRVLVRKIDSATGKISLAMRDLMESPWAGVATKFPVTSVIHGRVTKIMDFGAFVELEPGIEGLVHISELSHSRVFRVRDVVQEGSTIEAKILSIDPDQQRISLSMKAIQQRPEHKQAEPEVEESAEPPAPLPPSRHKNLKGGVERSGDGGKFGLKW